jgi:hypothetical protein
LIHRRDSKPANADLWEEKHWKCGSERAAAGAREERESEEENLTLSVDSQERFEANERRSHLRISAERGSERAAAGAREERESEEENLTLSVDSQEGSLSR